MEQVLESPRLFIRALEERDREACEELLTADFDYYYGPYDELEDIDKRFRWIVDLTNWKSAGAIYGDHGVFLKESGECIGLCGIDPWVWHARIKRVFPEIFPEATEGVPCTTIEFELGYAMKAKYRGQGYATEAVLRLVEWAFQEKEVAAI